MLQSVLNGQVSIRKDIKKVESKIDKVEKNLTVRIDRIGSQLAHLEDDAPTKEEHEDLEKRVDKVETRIAST